MKIRVSHHPILNAIAFAFCFSSVAYALRALRLSEVHFEAGLGCLIKGCGVELTFAFFILMSLMIRGVQLWRGWLGILSGAALGFSLWFLWSMLVGTFPSLDVSNDFTHPRGGPFLGSFGSVSFYFGFVSSFLFGGLIAVRKRNEGLC